MHRGRVGHRPAAWAGLQSLTVCSSCQRARGPSNATVLSHRSQRYCQMRDDDGTESLLVRVQNSHCGKTQPPTLRESIFLKAVALT